MEFIRPIREDNEKRMKQLLAQGRDPNTHLHELGLNLLLLAIDLGKPKMVKILLQANADPDLGSEDGQSPLSRAIQEGNPEIIKLLIEAGADLFRLTPEEASHPLIEQVYKQLLIRKKRRPSQVQKVATAGGGKQQVPRGVAQTRQQLNEQIMDKVLKLNYDKAYELYRIL